MTPQHVDEPIAEAKGWYSVFKRGGMSADEIRANILITPKQEEVMRANLEAGGVGVRHHVEHRRKIWAAFLTLVQANAPVERNINLGRRPSRLTRRRMSMAKRGRPRIGRRRGTR
jgi:hypothetical protein